MRILMIIEGLGLLYCLYSWIRDHPKSKIEWVVSVGIRISKPGFRHWHKWINKECCELMFPDVSDAERKRKYLSFRIGGILLGMLIGNAVFLLSVYMDTPEAFPGIQLERPAYGQSSRELQYQLTVRSDGKKAEGMIDIEIPEQLPSSEEIRQQMIEAENMIQQIFQDSYSEGTHLELPDKYKEILFFYQSLSPTVLNDDGQILWDNIQKEQRAQMRVQMIAGENMKESIMELNVVPEVKSLEHTIETVQNALENGEYLSEDALQLPTEGSEGVIYEWSLPQDNSFVWMGLLWILLFPILVSCLREQERKQKVRLRNEQIRRRYPDMLNKLMILMGAGMSMTKAWIKITDDYQIQKVKYNQSEPLYEEMLRAGMRLNNGYSMSEVIRVFAQRNSIKEIQQFCGILQTGWKRGDTHVLVHLKELHDRSWEIRKRSARKLSEEADTKLLLPLMLMLMVVLIIVLAPAMMTMKI